MLFNYLDVQEQHSRCMPQRFLMPTASLLPVGCEHCQAKSSSNAENTHISLIIMEENCYPNVPKNKGFNLLYL